MQERDPELDYITSMASSMTRFSIDGIVLGLIPISVAGLSTIVTGEAPEPILRYPMLVGMAAAATAAAIRFFQVADFRSNGSESQWSVQLDRAENRGMDAIKAAARTISLQVRHLARTLTRKPHISF